MTLGPWMPITTISFADKLSGKGLPHLPQMLSSWCQILHSAGGRHASAEPHSLLAALSGGPRQFWIMINSEKSACALLVVGGERGL